MDYCTRCGTARQPGNRFCTRCGIEYQVAGQAPTEVPSEPTLAAAPSERGAPPIRMPGLSPGWYIGIAVVVAAIVAVPAVLILIRSQHLSSHAADTHQRSSPILSSTEALGTSGDTETSLPSTSEATSNPPPPPTLSPGGINIAAVARNPYEHAVVAMFDTYFDGVNTHNPTEATSVYDPAGVVNPNDPAQVERFGEQTSTSIDDQIVVHSISANANTSGNLLASVTFRSRQAASLGPDGETCTNWSLIYDLSPANGTYLIFGTIPGVAYNRC
jgi:hypothetical protein